MPFGGVTIVDTTLREGEQFIHSNFSSEHKLELAHALCNFGVRFLEVTSPAASRRSRLDAERIAAANLPATITAHIRCHTDDAAIAIDSGVDGLNMVMAVSPVLRAASHGRTIPEVVQIAAETAEFIRARAPGMQIRFSTEDTFRCPIDDLLGVYQSLSELELFDRFGVADTTGTATPNRVAEIVDLVSRLTGAPIEFHGHNDIGCAVANAQMAILHGASHINTSILGIGERNGITSLEGLIAVLYSQDAAATKVRFNLPGLRPLCAQVAAFCDVPIPFNQVLVGETAFSHKAGLHTKAVNNDPRSYEALDPEDFGLSREIAIGHRLTGWNAIRVRSEVLGHRLPVESLKEITARVKSAADRRPLSIQDVDTIIAEVAADCSAG